MAIRAFKVGENHLDVINKINKFIGEPENVDGFLEGINNIMKGIDNIERISGTIEDERYRNEIFGYIAKMRQYVISSLDAFDSMMGM